VNDARPRVVIVGAGFGGLAAARALRRAPVEITIVDQRNHHLFQPLLYQVATGGLSPADIAAPIRAITRRARNTRVVLDTVVGLDPARRRVRLQRGAEIGYDFLIIATGAETSYFGNDDWRRLAPGLKSLEDAIDIRRNILVALERAETEPPGSKRDALLTFVVVGGGPTGCEMAGAIAELARQSVSRDFRSITPRCSRVVLVDAAPGVLAGFRPGLAAAARRSLAELGVELRLGAPVSEVRSGGLVAGGEFIAAGTVVWAAGTRASPAAAWLGAETDRGGRIRVDADLRVPGHDGIFAIGDTAACAGEDGQPLPGVAPVAKQQGEHVARLIVAQLRGKNVPRFRYRDYGMMATIGRHRAVAAIGRVAMTGPAAWLLWSAVHVLALAGFRNRAAVTFGWLWHYLTFDRSARLITGVPTPVSSKG
jgi:NADH:ubiquinone reductase (H+-translocating)